MTWTLDPLSQVNIILRNRVGGVMSRLVLLILSVLPLAVNAASFDCKRAWNRVERAICADPHLSKMDDQLGRLYSSFTQDINLKQQQRIWILSRNQCAISTDTKQCIESSYLSRISQLQALAGDTQQHQASGAVSIPVSVVIDYSLRTGNWYPLPEKDMKAAAADTALAKLSETGNFSIVANESGMKRTAGRMNFNISLVGPAEIAKLTIELRVPGQPSFISTASISVKGLDYQGIYKAFEHIGNTSAAQMLAKFDAYVMRKPEYRRDELIFSENDDKLRDIYQLAQTYKSDHKYQEARLFFEKVTEADKTGVSKWKALAEDELRYGLRMFEAKQSIISMGRYSKEPLSISREITNAKNLLRQVLADNIDDVKRISETQKMLDDLDVSSQAFDVAMQSRVENAKVVIERNLRAMVQRKMNMYFMTSKSVPDGVCEKDDFMSIRDVEVIKQLDDKSFIVKDTISNQEYMVKCSEDKIDVSLYG